MAGALADADVLIEALRGDTEVLSRIDAAAAGEPRFLSVLTAAELRAGGSGDEPAVGALIADFVVLDLELSVAEHGGRLRRRFAPTHGTDLIDAMLAALALAHDLTLVTNNRRHYPMPSLRLG
ncbi:MAG: PIN domain-containing protein [Solirubrobacterales bacterium]|nr:PIN domain-containing protein [Solirubrobacterales bacterium]